MEWLLVWHGRERISGSVHTGLDDPEVFPALRVCDARFYSMFWGLGYVWFNLCTSPSTEWDLTLFIQVDIFGYVITCFKAMFKFIFLVEPSKLIGRTENKRIWMWFGRKHNFPTFTVGLKAGWASGLNSSKGWTKFKKFPCQLSKSALSHRWDRTFYLFHTYHGSQCSLWIWA